MIIGIDLGTTNSLVAAWLDGKPTLIPNALGEFLTPSCVSIDEDGQVLVGRAARDRLQTHPARSASVFKRYMGSGRALDLAGKSYHPEELSALVLRSLKADAEAMLGHEVTEAIITVPAYFSDAQRKATRTAGQLAGLKVDRLLNEPTAAALAYGLHEAAPESQFLVFDLGGGTFDVSVLQMFEGVMEVRASAGDNMLGGEDFTQLLVQGYFGQSGVPDTARDDASFRQRLIARADIAKRELAGNAPVTIALHWRDQEYSWTTDATQFAVSAEALLARLWRPVEGALRDARIPASELNNVVLAGGATRMPLVRQQATRMFGRFPESTLDPDHVVALGAAVQAGLRMKDAALDDIVMTDVCPYSMGVEVAQHLPDGSRVAGFYSVVIERNTVVPTSRVGRYHPTGANQTGIDLQIYQGESRLVRDNIKLGSIEVPITRRNGEGGEVDVRFTYDANGLLEVEVVEIATSARHQLVITSSNHELSEAEIAERLKILSALKIHPRDTLANRSLMAEAERVFQLLLGSNRDRFGQWVGLFEQALASQDERLITDRAAQLRRVIAQIEANGFLEPEPV